MPLTVEPIDWIEPASLAAAIGDRCGLAWLDGAPDDPRGRMSYLCPWPAGSVEHRDGRTLVDGRALPDSGASAAFAAMRAMLGPRAGSAPAPFGFAGGLVALLGYGIGRALVGVPSRHRDGDGAPDLLCFLHRDLLAFDGAARRAWLVAAGDPAPRRAELARWIADADRRPPAPPPVAAFRPELDRARHGALVDAFRERIAAGEIFQANLTGRARADRPAGLRAVDAQALLRARGPAPFGAMLVGRDGFALCGVSPERFLSLDPEGRVETRPIKGTAPRGADPAEDDRLAARLAASAKDRAEHLMIVDLMRNDLSRVCRVGSVRVPVLQAVERFASVHHMVSSVEGRLEPGRDAFDLLRATLPGGSVTGAPKIRAMTVIDELEASARGPYCGAVAWIGRDGAMDSCIVIRSLVLTAGAMAAAAGGAITSDSDPDGEWREMGWKLAPVRDAFAPARAGAAVRA